LDKVTVGTLYHISGEADGISASEAKKQAYQEAEARLGVDRNKKYVAQFKSSDFDESPKVAKETTYTSYPPGRAGEVARWLEAGNAVENHAASIASVLAFSSAVCGRSWSTGAATEDGINLYMCLLCPSAGGKDWMWNGLGKIIIAAGLKDDIGKIMSPQPASEASLTDTLQESPSTVLRLSEMGVWLQRILQSGSSAGPEKGIERALLDLYSRSVPGSAYQGPRRTKTERTVINEPSLSVFGDSTLTKIYSALSDDAAQSGLVGRMVFLSAPVGRDRYVSSTGQISSSIESYLQDMAQHWTTSQEAFRAPVKWSIEADRVNRVHFDEWADLKARSPEHVRLLISRVRQNAQRIAANLGIWDNPNAPEVQKEHVEWAWLECMRSANMLIAAYENGDIQSSHSVSALEILSDYCLAKCGIGEQIERRTLQNGLKRKLVKDYSQFSRVLKDTLADALACGVLAPVPRSDLKEGTIGVVYYYNGPPLTDKH
jgi:hypothetical protein